MDEWGSAEQRARSVIAAVLGPGAATFSLLQTGPSLRVWSVKRADRPERLVLKLADANADARIDYARTADLTARAAAAGVPVAEVLAAGPTEEDAGGQYLLQRMVEGTEWRLVRPTLDSAAECGAHAEIARAVVALQSVAFDSFGPLDLAVRPPGSRLLPALHDRVELRVRDPRRRALGHAVLDRHAGLFAVEPTPTLCHDDLHHQNLIFSPVGSDWRLAAVLDWDKAWAGPPESDVARMAWWDDMTGPGFWAAYRAAVPALPGGEERFWVHQLLWCLEYDVDTPRHRADTDLLGDRLGFPPLTPRC